MRREEHATFLIFIFGRTCDNYGSVNHSRSLGGMAGGRPPSGRDEEWPGVCRAFLHCFSQARLEGESGSKLAGEGTWDDGAARVDEAERLEEAGGGGKGVGDVDVVVGAVVGAVGHIERLVEQRDGVAVVNRDGVGDTGVEREEHLTAVGLVSNLAAAPRSKAILVKRGGGGLPTRGSRDRCLGSGGKSHEGVRTLFRTAQDSGRGVPLAPPPPPDTDSYPTHTTAHGPAR